VIAHLDSTRLSKDRIRSLSSASSTLKHQERKSKDTPSTLHNLSPDLLDRKDYRDISGMFRVQVRLKGDENTPASYFALQYDIQQLVPAGSTGFLYFHLPDPTHPIGATLRFRITGSSDSSSFADGHDLCLPGSESLPWESWISPLVHGRGGGRALAQMLNHQGLIQDKTLKKWEQSFPTALRSPRCLTPTARTFVINLQNTGGGLYCGRVDGHQHFRWTQYGSKRTDFSWNQFGSEYSSYFHSLRYVEFHQIDRLLVCLEEDPHGHIYGLRILKFLNRAGDANSTAGVAASAFLQVGDIICPSWWKSTGSRIWKYWHEEAIESQPSNTHQ
jgi:hypothetical protein